jgi:hypothetical protein
MTDERQPLDTAVPTLNAGFRESKPLAIENVALGALFLATVALSLVRMDMVDTPVHLATAREAFATGRWPVTNTFSYTHVDHPLYQQYPLYQALLYLVYAVGGWGGLSILHVLTWLLILPLWFRWGGGLRAAALLSAAWLLALLGLRQRMLLRPDLLTILLFVCLLLVVDSYCRGKTWVASLFVVLQWLMVNSHQLYPLGLATQGALLVHLITVRRWGGKWGISTRDAKLLLWPVGLVFVLSVVVCFGTPLGSDIFRTPFYTASTVFHHRKHVDELISVFAKPGLLVIVTIATLLGAVSFWRARRDWQPFDLFLWLMVAAMVSVAIRGVALYTAVCVGLYARNRCQQRSVVDSAKKRHPDWVDSGKMIARLAAACLTIAFCVMLCYVQWVAPPRGLLGGGMQPGIGMALGVWPTKTMDFLGKYPVSGQMLNLPWYTANWLIWDLYPKYRVFVDPRFEAYPRNFLVESNEAEKDDALLAGQISRYQPNWIVAEVRRQDIQQRIAHLLRTGEWVLVHVDTVLMVLVRDVPENAPYIAAHRLDPGEISPPDYLDGGMYPDLLALQKIRIASLLSDLGQVKRSRDLIGDVEPLAGRYGTVREALEEFRKNHS